MICRGLYILASGLLVVASSNNDEETSSATGVQRQFIGSQGFGQNAFSQTPFPMPSNGMNPIRGMNGPQLNANQLQLLAAMQKDPRMRQQMAGLLPQIEGGGGGIGQPLGESGNEENTLMHNPITAPDGLTRDVLKSLMFGNVGEISPPYGNGMGYPSNDMTNSFNNGPASLPAPRKLDSLINSFAAPNHQAGSEGFPVLPKFNFGGQDRSQEGSVFQTRHHHRHGHSKKRKSDTVTKLLLSLLVDKLKDIYEMDKFNTSLARKQNPPNLETTSGKIGDDLHSADNEGNNDQTHEEPDQRDQQRKGTFQTNLSFPLTVSDEKSTGVHLIDSIKKGTKNKTGNFQVDSASIDTIIKGIESNQTLKMNPALSKSAVKTGVNRELKDLKNVAGNLSLGPDTAEKTTKSLGDEDFVKNPDTGSFAEFHTIKMPLLKSANQSESIPSVMVGPAVKAEDIETTVPLDGSGAEQITSLPSFSVSPFLNRDESQSSITATDRVLSQDSQSYQANSSSTELEPVNDLSTKPEDTTSVPEKQGNDNYLEASRVLGSVYNKVKNPLAKKSVETAIKAMLKLIASDSSFSKKGNVPSLESVTKSATDYQRETSGLQRSFNEFVRSLLPSRKLGE